MNKLIYYVLAGLVFLFPLFFLPITQEFYITNKLYLVSFGAVLVVLLSGLWLLMTKKISWKKGPLDTSVVLFVLTVGLSIVISSPNKIASLINPSFGLAAFLALTILFFAISQVNHRVKVNDFLNILGYSSLVLAVVSILFFLQPLKNAGLPQNLQFLKSPNFNPMGGIFDLAVLLGFVIVLFGSRMIFKKTEKPNPLHLGVLFVSVVAFVLALYSIFKPLNQGQSFLLPPYRLSWYAAVETLKNPLTALFGVGVDNFSSIFTRVKDVAYNQSNLWQVNSFNISRSALLHTMSSLGVFGLLAYFLLLFTVYRTIQRRTDNQEKNALLAGLGYVVLSWILMPPSLVLLFMLFFFVSLINKQAVDELSVEPAYYPLAGLVPVYAIILGIAFVFVGGSSFFLAKTYASEYYFKKSLDGLVQKNATELYNNQRRAVQLNPYNEGYRISFSQTNLLIANSTANRARQAQQKQGGPQQGQQQQLALSEQDKQTITQAVQAAIQEAKAAVALNPQKANSWENLAAVYRSIVNVAQGADVWTLSSYQRAINLDPRNPIYYLNLGGVFYAAANYNQSTQLFTQSASLKQDWANAHYNLAWSLYRQENFQAAANEMQTVLTLLEKNKDSQDYKRAQKEFEQFKSKIPPAGATESTGAGELKLPQQPEPKLSPKLELPKNAEPPREATPAAR